MVAVWLRWGELPSRSNRSCFSCSRTTRTSPARIGAQPTGESIATEKKESSTRTDAAPVVLEHQRRARRKSGLDGVRHRPAAEADSFARALMDVLEGDRLEDLNGRTRQSPGRRHTRRQIRAASAATRKPQAGGRGNAPSAQRTAPPPPARSHRSPSQLRAPALVSGRLAVPLVWRRRRTFHDAGKRVRRPEEAREDVVAVKPVRIVPPDEACATARVRACRQSRARAAAAAALTTVAVRDPLLDGNLPELVEDRAQLICAPRAARQRRAAARLREARRQRGGRRLSQSLSTSKASDTSSKFDCASASSHRSGCHFSARLRYLSSSTRACQPRLLLR